MNIFWVSARSLWLGAEQVAFCAFLLGCIPHCAVLIPLTDPTQHSQATSRQDPDRGHCAGPGWGSWLVYSRQFCLGSSTNFHGGIVTLSRPPDLLLSQPLLQFRCQLDKSERKRVSIRLASGHIHGAFSGFASWCDRIQTTIGSNIDTYVAEPRLHKESDLSTIYENQPYKSN